MTVDGRNPANQLRLVVYPIIYKVLYIPGCLGFLPPQVSCLKLHRSSLHQSLGRCQRLLRGLVSPLSLQGLCVLHASCGFVVMGMLLIVGKNKDGLDSFFPFMFEEMIV